MFEKEADEVIGLVFSTISSAERTRLVAHYITELIGASAHGCTGLQADPDGPELAATDPVASGAAVLADATDAEVDGFLGAVRDLPEDEPTESGRHPDAYEYGEPWGPDNPAPGSPWAKARGAVPRGDGPRAEEVIRRLRDQTEPGV